MCVLLDIIMYVGKTCDEKSFDATYKAQWVVHTVAFNMEINTF